MKHPERSFVVTIYKGQELLFCGMVNGQRATEALQDAFRLLLPDDRVGATSVNVQLAHRGKSDPNAR